MSELSNQQSNNSKSFSLFAFYFTSAVGTAAGSWLLWNFAYFDFPRNNFYLLLMIAAGSFAGLAAIWTVNTKFPNSYKVSAPALLIGVFIAFAWFTLTSLVVCLLVSVFSASIFYLSLLIIGTGLIYVGFIVSTQTIYGFSLSRSPVLRNYYSWASLALTLLACYVWQEGFANDYNYQAGFTSSHLFIGKARHNYQIKPSDIQDKGLAPQSATAVAKLRSEISQQRDLSLESVETIKKTVGKSVEKLQSMPLEEITRHPEKAKPLIAQASALLERNQRQNFATELLQRAYSLDPLDPSLLKKLGAAEMKTQQYELALSRYAIALRIEPTKPDNWLGYADAMAMQPSEESLQVIPIESSIQAHLAGYWFAQDKKEFIKRLKVEPRPFTTEHNTKMDLSSKLALHRIARVDSQIKIELSQLPNMLAFKNFEGNFLEYAEKTMNMQSFEEARAHALNTLAFNPDNKTALRILKEIEAIELGAKPEKPGLWYRFINWIKSFFI
jgi:tetratricopeptide (TPR) repeat protein